MTAESKAYFLDFAVSQIPREACALLVEEKGTAKEMVLVCKNLAEQNDRFTIAPDDYLAASKVGKILAVIHSHVFKPSFPSAEDKISCAASGLPWHIVSVPAGTWNSMEPGVLDRPLIGRPFAYGVLDCYVLVQDYYREKLGVEIKDFDHGEFGWWDKGEEKFSKSNCEEAGFTEVSIAELEKNDVLLMQIHGKAINHLAIYLGNDQILHHLTNRLSARAILSGYYRRHTVRVMRYNRLIK